MSGRTALSIGAEFFRFMCWRRFVRIVLLACYGIPAVLGPGWHHHGHGDSACCHHQQTCDRHAHDLATAHSGHSHGDSHQCPFSHGAKASKTKLDAVDRASERASYPHFSSASALADQACLICAFYAKAQLGAIVFKSVAAPSPVLETVIGDVQETRCHSRRPSVRGPPTAMLT